MQKMTIAEAAELFGVSKEAIHNRVRRGSLLVEMIDGEKYVFVDENASVKTESSPKKPRAKSMTQRASKTTQKYDDRYYDLLKEQNTKLQEKVEKLEVETRSLRDQKEQMLIEERIKIEQIYKDKDEQLKSIIGAISSKFMLGTPTQANEIDADIIEHSSKENGLEESNLSKVSSKEKLSSSKQTRTKFKQTKKQKNPKVKLPTFKKAKSFTTSEQSILTSLNKYLKTRDFSKNKRKKIKARFKENAKKDARVIVLNNKFYIDLGKYSYKDYLL